MRIPQFEAFRQQYAAASLTSDLLAIHENHYVVRAQVRLEGNLLSSAMAADTSLEAAEDRAYQRAIDNLLTEPAPVRPPKSTPTPPHPTPSTSLSAAHPAPAAPASAATAQLLPLEQAAPAPAPQQVLEQPSESAPEPAPEQPPEQPSEQALEQLLTPLGKPAKPSLSPLSEPPLAQSAEPLASDLDLPPLPEAQSLGAAALASDPIDLSDIIAQTDVELRRLGWTTDQGREFLQKTYGKRSRHDLSDQELLEFLLFLETQMPLIGR